MNTILVIGSLPPPIGGVTVHVERLLYHLSKEHLPYVFFALKYKNLFPIFRTLLTCRCCHLHTSNPYVRLGFALLCKLFFVRLIITIHGNLGRFGRARNLADCLAIKLCATPIVLNRHSMDLAKKWNPSSLLLSVFLPPAPQELLPSAILEKIEALSHGKNIYLTNAFAVSFDKSGREIYGISELIQTFRQFPKKILLISNSTNDYPAWLHANHIDVPNNVVFLTEPHRSSALCQYAHALIRNTTTDGDSVSVKEALYAGILAFATDAVSRPQGTITYSSQQELAELISKFDTLKPPPSENLSDWNSLKLLYTQHSHG